MLDDVDADPSRVVCYIYKNEINYKTYYVKYFNPGTDAGPTPRGAIHDAIAYGPRSGTVPGTGYIAFGLLFISFYNFYTIVP